MMTNMKSMEDLLSIEYETSIVKRGVGYVARFRDLNISANGKSITDAIQNLDKKKRAFFEDMVENDSLDNIPEPGRFLSRTAGTASMSNVYSVIRNTVLIVVVIASFTFFAGPVITERISHEALNVIDNRLVEITDRISHKAINVIDNRLVEALSDGHRLRKGIRQTLSDIAANVKLLTPVARDELLSNVRTIVAAVKPFINEAKPLYCPPQAIKGNGG